jgi:histidine triad (HIT) family protein
MAQASNQVTPCYICDVLAGREAATLAYEDNLVVAVLASKPINQGELVIIPKKHASTLAQLGEETSLHLFKVTMRMMEAIGRSGIKSDGFDLQFSEGRTSFKDHLFLALLPRFKGDYIWLRGMRDRDFSSEFRERASIAFWAYQHGYDAGVVFSLGREEATPERLDEVASKLRESYESLWRDDV